MQTVKGVTWNTSTNGGYVSLEDIALRGTDATAAIAAVLTVGIPLYIPIGEWLITSLSIPANSIIYGSGGQSRLKLKDVSNSSILTVGTGSTLSNFRLDGNKLNQVGSGLHGIICTGVSNVILTSVNVINCKGSSYYVTGASDSVVLNTCTTSGWTESGIKVDSATNILLSDARCFSSDVAATGDGISIASNGAAITNVTITGAMVKNNTGRGIALLGNGSKNVTNVSIVNSMVVSNTSHGIHMINTDSCTVTGGTVISNGADGIRLEGDVQNCRINVPVTKANTTFGLREVVAGSTPNFNGLIYAVCSGNGNNTITKVGASSYIV